MNQPVKYNKFASDNILNSIRRVLINEIPIWTIDNVEFDDFNSSVYNQEYIIQRLRLIPLLQENIPEKTDNITVNCKINNNTPNWKKLTPKDIKCTNLSIEKIIRKEILENLPILYLPPNESINFKASLVKSSNYGYSKYCHAWYDDNYFYVESIDKCTNTTDAIKKSINYLIKACNKIKEKAIKKYNNISLKSIKIEMDFNNVSRSALNIIIEKFRNLMMYLIAYVKWFRNTGSIDNFPNNDYLKLVSPDDFIVSVLQPHMSEDKHRIFIDIKSDYIPLVNSASDVQDKYQFNVKEQPKAFITTVFTEYMKQQGKINPEIKHPCVRMFVQVIELVVEELSSLHTKIN